MAEKLCKWRVVRADYCECDTCGSTEDMGCPYVDLDHDLLNIKPLGGVVCSISDNEECAACQ